MVLATPAETSLAVLDMAQAGRFAEIRDMFAPQLRSMVTVEGLQMAWAAELDRRGRVTSIGSPVAEPAGPGMVVVKVPVTGERGDLTVVVSVHESGFLTGIRTGATSAHPLEILARAYGHG